MPSPLTRFMQAPTVLEVLNWSYHGGKLVVRLLATIFLAVAADRAAAQTPPESYSLFVKDDGRTWCAYKDAAEFTSEVVRLKPTESAAITYSSDKLVELTYQVEAESGDWIVIDKYTASNGEVHLRRANLLTQQNLQIIQETVIHGSHADPFHLVRVTTLDGQKAQLSTTDFPTVPVRTNLPAIAFVKMVAEMRSLSIGKLCKRLD